jgi:hypothetical protein
VKPKNKKGVGGKRCTREALQRAGETLDKITCTEGNARPVYAEEKRKVASLMLRKNLINLVGML